MFDMLLVIADSDGRAAADAPFVLAAGRGVVAASSGGGFAEEGKVLKAGEWVVTQAEPYVS